MKIAVFHNLPSGGAKRALYGFVTYLNQQGHDIDVHVPQTANEDFLPLRNAGANLNVYPVKKTLKGSLISRFYYLTGVKEVNLKDLENTQKRIADTINSKDYDVVISEQDQYTMTPFFLKYIEKPTIYYCQQPPRNDVILERLNNMIKMRVNPLKERVYNLIDKRAAKKDLRIDRENFSFARYILANSYFSHESILKTYGSNSFVSYLGVDNKFFKPLKLPNEDFVLSVGTCTPSKGYDFIIRSLALVESKIRPKFVVVSNAGNMLWENYLTELASRYNVEIEILRLVDDNKLVELYNKSKIVLYAPYLEPFGLVPLESMACGIPVVGVKEGGIRESVIDNETGILTQRDERLFAKAIIKLLRDDEEISRMSKRSTQLVNKFWTLEQAGKRLEKHLIKVSS